MAKSKFAHDILHPYPLSMQCNLFSLSTYIFVPEIPNNVDVGTGVADKLPLEEGNVDDGGVEVDELEDEDFEGEIIVEI